MSTVNVTDPQGWIPYEHRTPEQKRQTDEFHEEIGRFQQFLFAIELPERVLLHELEIKATGKLMPRIHQLTGSCVGCGGARAYCHAQCGDVVDRGDHEEIKLVFPFATYGVGRQIAGSRGRGEGSYGGAQAKAVQEFGMLPVDHPKVPQATYSHGWATWRKNEELDWSYPTGWPTPRAELEKDANQYQIQTVTRLKSTEEVCQCLAQGYGITMACNFGSRTIHVVDNILMAEWDGSWAHQQAIAGYWKHPRHGYVFVIDNQWDDVHGHCPTLFPLGVTGSYWITESTLSRIITGNGEVYGHSNTKGFPARSLDWGDMGIS